MCVFDRVPKIVSGVLRAYVLCTLKTCEMARECVRRGDIYEEDEFSLNRFGYDLAVRASVPLCCNV